MAEAEVPPYHPSCPNESFLPFGAAIPHRHRQYAGPPRSHLRVVPLLMKGTSAVPLGVPLVIQRGWFFLTTEARRW